MALDVIRVEVVPVGVVLTVLDRTQGEEVVLMLPDVIWVD
jgi:hypothetical protein